MAKNFSVDDILNEIHQKKQQTEAFATGSASEEKKGEENFFEKRENVKPKEEEKFVITFPEETKKAPEPKPAEPVVKKKLQVDEESLREFFSQNEDIAKLQKSKNELKKEPDITELEGEKINEYIPKDMTRHFEKIKSDPTLERERKRFTKVRGGFLENGDNDVKDNKEYTKIIGSTSSEEKKVNSLQEDKIPNDPSHLKIQKFMNEVAEPTNQNIHAPSTPEAEGVRKKYSEKENREIAKEVMQDMHEPDTDYDPEDFEKEDQIPVIEENLTKMHTGYLIKTGILTVLFIASLLLCIAPFLGITLPEFIAFSKDNTIFPMVNLGLVLISALVSYTLVGNGLIGLLKFKGGNDTFSALSVLGASTLGIIYSVYPSTMASKGENLLFPVTILCLLFANVGNALSAKRIKENFKVLTVGNPKNALLPVHNKDLARELTGQIDGIPRFCTTVKARFFTRFMDLSFKNDVTEGIARVITPIIFIGGIAVAAISYFFSNSIFESLIGLSAIYIMSAPFASTLAGAIPVYRSCKALNKENSMLAGGNSAESFAETDSVLLDIEDIFPAGSIVLHGIKTFARGRIDEAILDAASVICNTKNTLESIFLNVVQGDRKLLKPVDSIIYEDEMGLSAWVDGKRVLIGNRELMINHNIDIPSHDYENKYVGAGRDILYLANSGELTAMFVISYHADDNVFKSLSVMADRNVKLVINCSDPNITTDKLANLFDFPEKNLKLLSSRYQQKCAELTKARDNAPAAAVYDGRLETLSNLLSCCGIIRQSSFAASLVEIIAIILGFILVTFYLFTGSINSLAMVIILAYQLFWLLADIIIILLRKRI